MRKNLLTIGTRRETRHSQNWTNHPRHDIYLFNYNNQFILFSTLLDSVALFTLIESILNIKLSILYHIKKTYIKMNDIFLSLDFEYTNHFYFINSFNDLNQRIWIYDPSLFLLSKFPYNLSHHENLQNKISISYFNNHLWL